MSPPARILLETEGIVCAFKPAGVAVHRGWAEDAYPLLQRVRDTIGGQWVYAAHRLDRATSGLVLFARTSQSASALGDDFRSGRVDKRYLALTRGVVPEQGWVDHPVPRHKSKQSERIPAQTAFARLWAGPHVAWVAVRPQTGRLHQIRRHFKHLSHPLIGDVRYGKGALNREYRDQIGLRRLALHAVGLGFVDPVSGTEHRVVAPIPDDLAGPLARLGVPEDLIRADPWAPTVENRLHPSPKERDFQPP